MSTVTNELSPTPGEAARMPDAVAVTPGGQPPAYREPDARARRLASTGESTDPLLEVRR